MSSERLIDYEALAQDAMRGVVRTILARVSKTGLPGDHHFYISFSTTAEGVVISKRLKEKYREEMTIVLQHRFWDLVVADDRFEVKLTFDGIPERLVVPFRAIKVFFDPSVRYGLQFESPDFGPDATSHPAASETTGEPMEAGHRGDAATADVGPGTRTPERKAKPVRKPRGDKPADTGAEREPAAKAPAETAPAKSQRPLAAVGKSDGSSADPKTPKPAPGSGAQVVSLDAFRKK